MEALRLQRTPLRSAFTRIANSIEEEIKSSTPDLDKLATMLEQVEEKGKRLSELDGSIFELLLAAKGERVQEDYNREFEAADVYTDKLISCRTKVKRLLSRLEGAQGAHSSQASADFGNNVRKFRLPEIEFKKFGGDLRDWLGFWGQFQKIDADEEIALEDKFQYLLQATTTKSKAREIVESFPPTGENYSRAIEHLRSRFGREDTLVEVYVRDLLRLVLHNAAKPKSGESLSALYDKLETQLRSLETLGVTSEKYAAMLYPLIESCLPEEVLRAWERNRGFANLTPNEDDNSSTVSNRLSTLMAFLRSEVDGEQRIQMARSGFGLDLDSPRKKHSSRSDEDKISGIPTAAGLFSGSQHPSGQERTNLECIFCNKPHESRDCRQASKLTLDEKHRIIRQNKCCFICLKKNHIAKRCKSKWKCMICDKRHNTVICPEILTHRAVVKPEVSLEKKNVDQTLANQTCTSNILVQTLTVRVRGQGKTVLARALIDTGSQRSYISERLASTMNYQCLGQEVMTHSLFGGLKSRQQKHRLYRVFLSSLNQDYKCNFEVLDQAAICGGIQRITSGPWMEELRQNGITLSDADTRHSLSVDPEIQILIGADVAGKLLTGRVYKLKNGLVAVNTLLGWTIMGRTPSQPSEARNPMSVVSLFVKEESVANLWRLECIGILDPPETQNKADLQEAAMQHFRSTVKLDCKGRYEIALPWLDGHPSLSNSCQLAEKRLKSTVKKLENEGHLEEYQKVLDDWCQEGIIEEIPQDKEQFGHYLPHRAVVKECSTTKLRPVFDASVHERGFPSLNDCLEKGPNLLEQIPSILTRFRMRKIGVTSDIKQAFLQISVNPKDRDVLRFRWWENGDPTKPKIYRHCRVVFGVSASPFLLGATLSYHLENVSSELQQTAKLLQDSFYVDNCVTSLDNTGDMERFISEAKQIMLKGKFELRDWRHSYQKKEDDSDIRTDIELANTDDTNAIVPVLGLRWNLKEDTIACDTRGLDNIGEGQVTKRGILSYVQRVFDPIGFTCPAMLYPKLVLQESWKLKIPWDQELPPPLATKFQNWRKQLEKLQGVRIPRWLVGSSGDPSNISLHMFCDASKYAYASCGFIRSENQNSYSCQLVQAKVRVSPLKLVTIPRLELLACCIGARLAHSIRTDMRLPTMKTFYWTDSANALFWIKGEDQWGIFVANRVKEIRALSNPDQWYHIAGTMNPADLPSRGCTVATLLDLKWWEGPSWLRLPEEDWPKTAPLLNEEIVNAEKRKTVSSAVNSVIEAHWYCKRFSSFLKTVRVLGWIHRFMRNARAGTNRTSGELTLEEIQYAEKSLWKQVQNEAFPDKTDKRILALQPYADSDGILRVKTPILKRTDSELFRLPLLLPAKHPAVVLLIQWRHREICHSGVQILMSDIREKYWILQCRKTIRQVVKSCGRCRRYKATNMQVVPAPLPEDRVRNAAVFEITGIDLAGPLYLRGGQKAWLVLFTCAVFRAIHLELITSLSAEAFVQALRRFIARRGRPTTVYSDNGTNFVAVNSAFKKLNWQKIRDQANVERIDWHFIPPTGAWWGGWWERLIKMVKDILKRVLGRASLTYEELATVLCDTEGTINSRPITYLSSEADDPVPLSPAMFLQDIKEIGVPDMDALDKAGLNKRFRYRQTLKEDLRKRFRVEYLGQLKQASQHKKLSDSARVGQIVLIGSDNLKRTNWPLGKIVQVYPGKDGHIRVVRVKTASGELLRPVQRLYLMEVCDGQDYSKERINKSAKPNTDDQQPVIREIIRTKSGRMVNPPQRLTY